MRLVHESREFVPGRARGSRRATVRSSRLTALARPLPFGGVAVSADAQPKGRAGLARRSSDRRPRSPPVPEMSDQPGDAYPARRPWLMTLSQIVGVGQPSKKEFKCEARDAPHGFRNDSGGCAAVAVCPLVPAAL
jgi:hypothetical protein